MITRKALLKQELNPLPRSIELLLKIETMIVAMQMLSEHVFPVF